MLVALIAQLVEHLTEDLKVLRAGHSGFDSRSVLTFFTLNLLFFKG